MKYALRAFHLTPRDIQKIHKIAEIMEVPYSWVARSAFRFFYAHGHWTSLTAAEREELLVDLPPESPQNKKKEKD